MRLSVLCHSLDILYPCLKLITDEKRFDLIIEYSEVFYHFRKEFTGPMVKYAVELAGQGLCPHKTCSAAAYCLEQSSVKIDPSSNLTKEQTTDLDSKEVHRLNKTAVDVLGVIVGWGKSYLKKIAEDDNRQSTSNVCEFFPGDGQFMTIEDVSLAVNILLKVACQVDPVGLLLSKRSTSLIYDLVENKILPLSELEFGNWMNSLFKQIAERPKDYDNCEIFTLMTSLFPHLEIKSLRSFIQQLQDKIVDLFESEINVNLLKSLIAFLSKLIEKYPPHLEKREFIVIYNNIAKACTTKYFLLNSRAVILEAIGSYFPSCLNKISSTFAMLVDFNYLEKNTLQVKALSVVLGFLNKRPIFCNISNTEMITLFQKMILLLILFEGRKVEGLTSKIMLKIIGIMDLSVAYLALKKEEDTLTHQIIDCITKLFEVGTNLIRKEFSLDRAICDKFSTVLRSLRRRINFIRIINVYAAFGTISCQYQADCSRYVAEDLDYDVLSVICYLCDDYWETYDPRFKMKLFISLLSAVFENIHVKSGLLGYETNHGVTFPFSLLMELCNSDEKLTEVMWSELFLCVWNILSEDKKGSLCPKVWRFIKICRKQCEEDEALSSLKYVFIKTALISHCDKPFYLSLELISKLFYPQKQSRFFLEKSTLSVRQAEAQQLSAFQTLTDLYCAMDENDVQLCMDALNASYNQFTIGATEYYRRGEYLQSHNSYLKSLQFLRGNCSLSASLQESNRCMEQMIRCAVELSNWENSENMDIDYRVLLSTYPLSKSKALVNSPLKKLIFKSKKNVLDTEDITALKKEYINEAISQCINQWNFLPPIYSSINHYTLLQLMQQFTELLEVYHLLDLKKINSKCDNCAFMIKKKFESTASRWDFHPHSFSDNFSFISELFNVRQKSLEIYAKKCHKISLYDIADQTTDLSNDFAIKLASTGMDYQRMTVLKVRFKEYSLNNAFELMKLKYTSILRKTRKLISQNKLNQNSLFSVNEELEDLLMDNCSIIDSFDRDKKGAIVLYDNKIRATLDTTYPFASAAKLEYEIPQMVEGHILVAELFERNLQESSRTEDAYLLMCCMLNACNYGTPLDIRKFIPRILHCLEYDDGEALLANELHSSFYKSDVLHKYYIPYLPYLISVLLNAIVEKKACEEAITGIFKMLSIKFPQQVFFSLESIRGVQPEDETEDKRNEIVSFLKEKHYTVIFKLEMVQKCLKQFEKVDYDYLVQLSQEALFKVCCITKENIKNEKLATEKVLEYLNDNPLCKSLSESLPNNLRYLIIKFKEELITLNELKTCNTKKIISMLETFVSDVSSTSKASQPKFYSFENNSPVLSPQFMNNDVCLFNQLSRVDPPSTVKIYRFCSQAVSLAHNNTLNYKIDVLGNDGKTYSFSLVNDVCREESIESLKLMHLLECFNPLLQNDHRCSQNFLKFDFTHFVFMGSHWRIVACYNDEILLRDNMPFKNFKMNPGNYSAKDYSRKFMDKVYLHPVDFDRINNRILRDLAVLCAAEFLNIRLKKQLVVHGRSGRLSVSYLEMNEEQAMSFTTLLTPDWERHLMKLRIKILEDFILDILTCLKENEESCFVVTAIMHLMKKNFPGDEHHPRSWNVIEDIVENLSNVNLVAVENFLRQNSV